jgi:hypothetical protein
MPLHATVLGAQVRLSTDASRDAFTGASTDASVDASTDASRDAFTGVSTDASTDASMDASAGESMDLSTDASRPTGGLVSGPPTVSLPCCVFPGASSRLASSLLEEELLPQAKL